MTWPDLLAAAGNALASPDVRAVLSVVVGFCASFVLFELQERRRVGRAQRELRRALISELEGIELLLSTTVAKYAHLAESPEELHETATELRWFITAGKERARNVGFPTPAESLSNVEQLHTLRDADLVALYLQLAPRRESVGGKIIVPIVESILAGRTAGFKSEEIAALSTVRWQAFLLSEESDWTRYFFGMTFTVREAGNHAIVQENHHTRLKGYALRARTLLAVVRHAQTVFRKGNA